MVIASSSSCEGANGCIEEEILFVVTAAAAAALLLREHWARSRARTPVLLQGKGEIWGRTLRLLLWLALALELAQSA